MSDSEICLLIWSSVSCKYVWVMSLEHKTTVIISNFACKIMSLKQKTFKFSDSMVLKDSRPQGYKTFFMLNSTEHEISTAHKN